MDIGMLWFDSDRAIAVSERVERAATYYKEKYGRVATLCLVHPSTLAEPSKVGHTEIQPMDTVQPNHFWLGIKPQPSEIEDDLGVFSNVTQDLGLTKQTLEA
ncbi:MAG: hypothetical protein V3U32_03450 [Anaerolineales bacterium]